MTVGALFDLDNIRKEAYHKDFRTDVEMIIFQVEIYDQIHFVRHIPDEGKHSTEAVELVNNIVRRLEDIPDGCSECFPFDMIEELKSEYGVK